MVFWDVSIVKAGGNIDEEKVHIGVHKCNDTDWERFYDVTTESEKRFNRIKDNESAFCLDEYDGQGNKNDFRIWGETEAMPHHRLDINFRPCIP